MSLGPRQRALLVAAAALAYAAALPPWNAWPLGWVALAPLFAAVVGSSPLAGFALGLGFELLLGMLCAAWLPQLLSRYLVLAPAGSFAGALAIYVVVGGVQTGAVCAWLAWASARGAVAAPWLGAAWWLGELARCATPIPFALLAATQTPAPLLVQSAELFGALGSGALIASVNALVAGALSPRLRGARPWATALGVGAVALASVGFGAARLGDAERAQPRSVRVAVVGAELDNATRFRGVDAARLASIAETTRSAGARGARLVLWPELVVDGSPARDFALRAPLADASRDGDLDLAFGALGSAGLAASAQPANSYYVVRGGTWADRYDKQRLLAPGETRGLGGLLGDTRGFAPGASARPLDSRFARLGVLLCSEAMFPALARERVLLGADLLVNPSNDVWFPTRAATEQQLAWVALRAVELRRTLLRPAANGVTAAVDPWGRIERLTPGASPLLLTRALLRDDLTLYARVGDVPAWIAAGALALDALRRRVRPRP